MFLYNTLTGKKEQLKTLKEGIVTGYFCGMTVQSSPHIGHFRAYLTADVLVRYLIYKGYEVRFIENFTDIDDKIIQRAQEENKDYRQIGQEIIDEFFENAEKLNLLKATYYPRATQHIQEIIDLINRLIEKGYAYKKNGDVYYRVEKFKGYGKLSGKKTEDLISGARIEINEEKESPLDFALWKKAKEGEPYWMSPWGKGRPGWHIECSAMSMHYLGETFDIHGGGEDLKFPHHENEIAQSEGATGKPFANYWIHTGMLNINKEKMSKSLGNSIKLADLVKRFEPDAIRLFLLQSQYRSQMDYSEELLSEAQKAYKRIKEVLQEMDIIAGEEKGGTIKDKMEMFEKYMDDDLNTPGAIAVVFGLIRDFHASDKTEEITANIRRTILEILNILGFKMEKENSNEDISVYMELFIEIRNKARKEKNWDLADFIRDELKKTGIKLEDTPKGTVWKRV